MAPRDSAANRARRARGYWIWGAHPLRAALANPARRLRRVLATEAARRRLPELPAGAEAASARRIAELLPEGAAHQGCAALAEPLAPASLADTLAAAGGAPLVVLDGVTDPRNVGAILRSAAAFGAAAVVVARRGAPPESGALAKAAAGALDIVPMPRVANLARALREIAAAGWWTVGLDGAAPRSLAEARPPPRCALALGAEGAGLRRLTREACDECAALPLPGAVNSLNVSNACAVALYAVTGAAARRPA